MSQLLPEEIAKNLSALYTTEGLGMNAMAQVKFFTPDSSWTWYLVEFDGVDTCFGLVIGHATEMGYFSLSELESVRGPLGPPSERDLYFKPTPLETRAEGRGR